jgi:peptidyl-dipeptidase Dcp
MTSYKSQFIKEGLNENISPLFAISQQQTKPSLLTFNEVTTLFHEFGHALHGMLANTTYPTLSEHPFTGFCGVTKSDYGKLVL